MVINILKILFCKHTYEFVRNIYGDEIRYLGWKRSVWKCSKCGKFKYSDILKNKVMKANEAPEKIYVSQHSGLHFYKKQNDDDIEYTRTDAFIEKACEWFRRIDYDDNIPPFETTEEFIEGFKKAMKL